MTINGNLYKTCLLLILYLQYSNAIRFRKAKPVLLISFDGLRDISFDEFIQENPNSNFKKFMDAGIR
jgi:hypothetical protein